jgi:hypothetical protein
VYIERDENSIVARAVVASLVVDGKSFNAQENEASEVGGAARGGTQAERRRIHRSAAD